MPRISATMGPTRPASSSVAWRPAMIRSKPSVCTKAARARATVRGFAPSRAGSLMRNAAGTPMAIARRSASMPVPAPADTAYTSAPTPSLSLSAASTAISSKKFRTLRFSMSRAAPPSATLTEASRSGTSFARTATFTAYLRRNLESGGPMRVGPPDSVSARACSARSGYSRDCHLPLTIWPPMKSLMISWVPPP